MYTSAASNTAAHYFGVVFIERAAKYDHAKVTRWVLWQYDVFGLQNSCSDVFKACIHHRWYIQGGNASCASNTVAKYFVVVFLERTGTKDPVKVTWWVLFQSDAFGLKNRCGDVFKAYIHHRWRIYGENTSRASNTTEICSVLDFIERAGKKGHAKATRWVLYQSDAFGLKNRCDDVLKRLAFSVVHLVLVQTHVAYLLIV